MTPFPVPERSDEEIASGTIRLALGGQERLLPVLPIARNRVWTAAFAAAIEKQLAEVPQLDTLGDASAAIAGATDMLIDLLVAYDEGGVLGGRDWIENNATAPQVYEAFKAVTAAAFPFGEEPCEMGAPAADATCSSAIATAGGLVGVYEALAPSYGPPARIEADLTDEQLAGHHEGARGAGQPRGVRGARPRRRRHLVGRRHRLRLEAAQRAQVAHASAAARSAA